MTGVAETELCPDMKAESRADPMEGQEKSNLTLSKVHVSCTPRSQS